MHEIDRRLGKPELAFPDPAQFGWAMVALGIALSLPGTLVLFLFVFATSPHHKRDANDWAGFGLGAFCLVGGAMALILAIRDMRRKPIWQLCTNGLVKTSLTGASRLAFWSDIPELVIVRRVRAGAVVGFYLSGGPHRVFVPNQAIADRAYDLWRAKQPIAVARPL